MLRIFQFISAGIIVAMASSHAAESSSISGKPIRNFTVWTDTAGKPISAHDGGITLVGDTFYWYGTSYRGNPEGLCGREGVSLRNGFNCYSSTNLVDWKYEGVCLASPKDGWLAKGTSHRPNVLRCPKTEKFVMWFFCFGIVEPAYPAAMLAVAVAEKPTGPFLFVGQRDTSEEHGWGQDLGLFQDSDGQGYLVYDDGHRNLRVDLLADDYLSSSKRTCIALKAGAGADKQYEGSAMVRYKGKYIVAGSGVQGWNPTETTYAVADAPLGPYREMGLMSEQKTWNSQISNFVYVPASDVVFAMCDQWFRGPTGQRVSIDESCQLWMPVSFDPQTRVAKMHLRSEWEPLARPAGAR
jgi:hypothetical protein